jgi:hypothetical protein
VPLNRITVLSPGTPEREIARVPTTEAEAPGMGRTIGAVVGGAAGAAGGIQAGTLASLFVPGIGPVIALGILGAAVLGIGGAAVGDALDTSMREGVPRDEVYVYEDALRRGRTVLIALVEDDEQAETARNILDAASAETVDNAREQWWIGLRDAEAERYAPEGAQFGGEERTYRAGFEAALAPDRRGRRWDEVAGELERRYPDLYRHEAFRRGYESGIAWAEASRRAERAA